MRAQLKRLRWLIHPISIFVVAQVSWGLLMLVWIRWYIVRNQELEHIVRATQISANFGTGQWIVLLEGCLLMAIILIGLYMIFVSFRKQVRLNKLQENILNSVTHELKTPLASIRLYSETMLMRQLSEADRLKFLRRTLAETERLQKLIDGVLISARMEGNLPHLSEAELADLVQLASAAWTRARERFGDKREFTLENRIESSDGTFFKRVNAHQMAVLFDNLLDNAVKFTNDKGKVTMVIEGDDAQIHIQVRDDGLGIERQHLKKVFNKFYRAEANSKKRVHGSGLGLFVCQGIVRSHGGSIHATSEGTGKGASLHVEFERHPVDH